MRLTTTGWSTLAGAAAMGVAGRLLGLAEWYVAAGAVAVVVAVSGTWLGAQVLDLDVRRSVSPPRIAAGGSCRVEAEVRSRRRRRSPVTVLTDHVDGRRRARLHVPPVRRGAPVLTQYRIPTTRRGLLRFGPLELEASDPFGIWSRRVVVKRDAEVVVLPAVVPLDPLPPAPGEEPDVGRRNVRMLQTATDEVSALREFRPGDDVRRVHWPSTAKTGTPIVRQYDEPWQRRVTILLDTAEDRMGPGAFERAVSLAASVLVAGTQANQMVRLLTPGGVDTGFVSSTSEVEAALDLLATIDRGPATALAGVRRTVARDHHGGTLVSVWGEPDPAALEELAAIELQYGAAVRGACEDWPDGTPSDRPTVVHDGHGDLATTWSAALGALAGLGSGTGS